MDSSKSLINCKKGLLLQSLLKGSILEDLIFGSTPYQNVLLMDCLCVGFVIIRVNQSFPCDLNNGKAISRAVDPNAISFDGVSILWLNYPLRRH